MIGITRDPESFEGHQFRVTRGDYAPLLKLVVEELTKAKVMLPFKYSYYKIILRPVLIVSLFHPCRILLQTRLKLLCYRITSARFHRVH